MVINNKMDFISSSSNEYSHIDMEPGESDSDSEIHFSKKVKDIYNEDKHTTIDPNSELLDHLGDYTEEPFSIIESYFKGKHLGCLVRHQIESYNHFVNYQAQKTIQMFNKVIVHSENDYVPETNKYFLEIEISFHNFKLYPPQIHENNGATKTMFPSEAKIRNFTYASTMTCLLYTSPSPRD